MAKPPLEEIKDNILPKFQKYQEQILNNYNALYEKVKSENDKIQKTYDDIKNNHSKQEQQSKYIDLSQKILNAVYMVSFWIYMILSIVLCVFIYYEKFSLKIKILLFVIIFGYPFYIYFLENLTYTVSIFLYNVILSTVYLNGYSNTNIEYSGQAMEEIMLLTAKSPSLSIQ